MVTYPKTNWRYGFQVNVRTVSNPGSTLCTFFVHVKLHKIIHFLIFSVFMFHSAIAALSLVGLLSLSALCMGCAYTCGAKPAKRRTMVQAVVRPSQSRITATPTASLSSSRQPATPQTPPQYSVSAEYTSRPYRLPTEAKTPEWNDLPPSYDLATAGVSFRVAALPSGGSWSRQDK